MGRFDTIIWDMDGTLLDTLKDLTLSVNFVMSMHDEAEYEEKDVREMVGNGKYVLMEKALPGGREHPDFDSCVAMFSKYYEKHMLDHTVPYVGIDMMLGELYRAGYGMAIVSNKFDAAVKGLNGMFFDDVISVAIGESETVRRKPAPDTVRRAMEELGANPERCVLVGDSEVDIETARNAGIACISVSWGFKSEEFLMEHGATCVVDTPEELVEVLLGQE